MTLHIAIANGERCKCLKGCCVFNLQQHYQSILLLLPKLIFTLSLKVELYFSEVWQAGDTVCTHTHKHTHSTTAWLLKKSRTLNLILRALDLKLPDTHMQTCLLTCGWCGYNVNDWDAPDYCSNAHTQTYTHTQIYYPNININWTRLLLQAVFHASWACAVRSVTVCGTVHLDVMVVMMIMGISGTWRLRACRPHCKAWPISANQVFTVFYCQSFSQISCLLFSCVCTLAFWDTSHLVCVGVCYSGRLQPKCVCLLFPHTCAPMQAACYKDIYRHR